MYKIFLVFLLFFANSTSSYGVEIASRVTDVTVYSDSATITRTATLDLPNGDHRVELVGFPEDLDPENLKVESDNSGVKIGQVSVKTQSFRDAQNPEVLTLDTEIQKLQLEIQVVKDSTKSAQLQLKFLESLAQGYSKEAWVGGAQANGDPASWQRALGFMQSGSATAYKAIRDNNAEVVELSKSLRLLENKREKLRGDELETSIVMVALTVNTDTPAKLAVHYQQWGARWRPVYEARLSTDSGKLALIQKAVVEQETQEPWQNAKVTLSTSQPLAQMNAPTVVSEFLNIGRDYEVASADLNYAAAPAQLEEVVVTGVRSSRSNWSGNFALSFPIPGRITVSNNSDEIQRYDLETFSFESDLITQIVPRQQTTAFLVARLTNNSGVPLYSSEMQVFVDGVLMGTSQLPTMLPGAEVELPMGQDRRIEVAVKDQGGLGGDAGLIKKQRVEVQDLIFEITNRRASSANIEVRSVYPTPKDKAIKVKIGAAATPPTERNENDQAGVMVWRDDVASGDTWRINYNYRMSYPADKRIDRVQASGH